MKRTLDRWQEVNYLQLQHSIPAYHSYSASMEHLYRRKLWVLCFLRYYMSTHRFAFHQRSELDRDRLELAGLVSFIFDEGEYDEDWPDYLMGVLRLDGRFISKTPLSSTKAGHLRRIAVPVLFHMLQVDGSFKEGLFLRIRERMEKARIEASEIDARMLILDGSRLPALRDAANMASIGGARVLARKAGIGNDCAELILSFLQPARKRKVHETDDDAKRIKAAGTA